MGGSALSEAAPTSQRRSRARRFARWANLALLLIIGGALLTGMYLVFATIDAERAEREQVQNTNEVLIELRNVGRAALNAETGQRGYLITLDRRYLQPYREGRDQYRPALDRLRQLMGGSASPRQQQLLDQIETLTETKFAELDETVVLLQQGSLLDARRRILTDDGQEVTARLRRSIREMEQIESNMLRTAAIDTARAEARVLPLLSGIVLLLLVALFMGYRLVGRTALAEAKAEQSAALAEARDRADLLARELNHRVKNLFAVVLAIVRMSGRDTPEAAPVVERISERIHALLTAHEVTQGTSDRPVASLQNLIETTLAPYRSEKMRADLSGPDVELPAKQVTPLGLVLHELTTNAVKYGAWAQDGLLSVDWRKEGERLVIDWQEDCETSGEEPERKGFGSMLVVSAARQLGGSITREFAKDGLKVRFEFPLTE